MDYFVQIHKARARHVHKYLCIYNYFSVMFWYVFNTSIVTLDDKTSIELSPDRFTVKSTALLKEK